MKNARKYGIAFWLIAVLLFTGVYLFFISGIRGIARIDGFSNLLLQYSAVFYLAACALLFACAAFLTKLRYKTENAPFHKNRAWIELDMETLRRNAQALQNILPASCELMPAVKANAYGHGAAEVCRELNKLGVRAFCVASVTEGVELRKRRIKGDILILGYTHPEQFKLLTRHRLTQTVVDYEYAKTLNDYGKRVRVHIKIDTGMKRLGEPAQNIENILQIFRYKNFIITGIYTHFSAQSDAFTQSQVEQFNNVLSKIRDYGFTIPKTHAQSSYGLLERPELLFDYARIGLALYGAYKDMKNTGKNIELSPVLSVRTRISAVKTVLAGDAVGYGSAFVAPHHTKLAVLSVGYADGLPRLLSCGVGRVLINGYTAPIVGYVCMDQTIVDVTNIENVRQGDIATIIGKDGQNEITAMDLAEQAETVPNEILSRLGDRLERYKQ